MWVGFFWLRTGNDHSPRSISDGEFLGGLGKKTACSQNQGNPYIHSGSNFETLYVKSNGTDIYQ